MYKAPRDKLVCILNCCKVISNLLLNASIASNENLPGADEFLHVLIYVTIKVRSVVLCTITWFARKVAHALHFISLVFYHFQVLAPYFSFGLILSIVTSI